MPHKLSYASIAAQKMPTSKKLNDRAFKTHLKQKTILAKNVPLSEKELQEVIKGEAPRPNKLSTLYVEGMANAATRMVFRALHTMGVNVKTVQNAQFINHGNNPAILELIVFEEHRQEILERLAKQHILPSSYMPTQSPDELSSTKKRFERNIEAIRKYNIQNGSNIKTVLFSTS